MEEELNPPTPMQPLIMDFTYTNQTSSNRSSMIDSPSSSILDISLSDGNLAAHIKPDGINGKALGLKGRQRHFSGGSLALDPFCSSNNLTEGFTNAQLAEFFEYFVKNKIRKAKICQHLVGFQIFHMAEVKNYPDINARSLDEGWTALHWACKNGHRDVVDALLHCQADPFIKNKNGSSPIHLAISSGHYKIVGTLLKKNPNLVNSKNELNGWYPIHTGAYCKKYECLDLLIQHGACVTQSSDQVPGLNQIFTPFHLLCHNIIRRKVQRLQSVEEIEENMRRMTLSRGDEDDVDDTDHELVKCYKIFGLFMKNLPKEDIPIVDDSKHGTILHCLAMLNYVEGVKTILGPPFNHLVDVESTRGITPLHQALNNSNLETAIILLEHGADPHLIHPLQELTPLQILLRKASTINELHLKIIDLMMEEGVDPSYVPNDSGDSPLYMATHTNLDVKLLQKFIDYVKPQDINVSDKYTGETLMHYAAVNCDSGIICKILEKDADIMIEDNIKSFDYEQNICEGFSNPKIPLQTSIAQNTSKQYFDAIKSFGIVRIIQSYKKSSNPHKLVNFLKTHLAGASKEMNFELVRELCHFLLEGYQTVPKPSMPELNHIIHFRSYSCPLVFHKTALNWANENNDKVIAMELIKFEKIIHHNKKCGLECFKENMSRDALLPWIIETYGNFFEKSKMTRQFMAGVTVFLELFVFSYMTFVYDYYSDISLLYQYNQFATGEQTNETLFSCQGTNFDTSCQEIILPYDDIKSNFNISFWITLGTILVSSFIYIYIVLKHSNPRWIDKLWYKIREGHEEMPKCRSYIVRFFAWFTYVAGIILCKIFWPFVHIARKFRYYASEKRSDHKDLTAESDDTWKIVKTVEYGIESSVQLFIQIWLLKPFFSYLTQLPWKELMFKSFHGILNFITFQNYPACYLERAMGKILLTLVSLSLGVALMKSTKPGIGPFERPLRTIPIFLSILLQTIARIVSLRSLIVLESPVYLSKYLIFLSVHVLFMIIIKFMFENRSKRGKQSQSLGAQMLCYYDELQPSTSLMNGLKFMISCLSSAIIMIHIHDNSSRTGRRQYSFISHSLFLILILAENLVLVILPFLVPSYFPSQECFRYESFIDSILWVLGTWFGAVLFQIIHYKWAHPWAELNGPQKTNLNDGYELITRLCWKNEIQKVTWAKGKLQRQDYDRQCTELENLKLEFNAHMNYD